MIQALNRTPLRLPAFRTLWLGLLISRMGDHFTVIALLWFVLDLTGSGSALSVVILCFTLPAILTSPGLGRLSDQFDPRRVMVVDNVARAVIIGAIPVLYWIHALDLWTIYVLSGLAGALSPATAVGVRVLLPAMVPDDTLEHANGLLSACDQLAALAGPAIAGLLVAVFGGPPALLIDALSFLVMALMLALLPRTVRTTTHTVPAGTPGGFGVLIKLREVTILTAMSFIFFAAYGPLEPALPVYARTTLSGAATSYGLLWSAFGVGALIGLAAIPRLSALSRPGVVFATIAMLWGALLAPLVVLTNLSAAMFFLAAAGCAWAPYVTIETTLLQRLTPPALHGRVFGARSSIMYASVPLGVLAGGILLAYISAPAVIGISAAACILTGVAGLLSPTLRSIRRGATINADITIPSTDMSTDTQLG